MIKIDLTNQELDLTPTREQLLKLMTELIAQSLDLRTFIDFILPNYIYFPIYILCDSPSILVCV
jgi:hypothetical protein